MTERPDFVPPLDVAVKVARKFLAEAEVVDIHNHGAVIQSHASLEASLRSLLAALDAESAGKDIPAGDESTRPADAARCPAAHPADPTPCDGPVVVTVLDAGNEGASGCEWHGARILASLTGGRVYPLPDAPEGAAIRVFKAAGTMRPFEWLRQGGDR